jgi:cytochrome P450
VTVTDRIALDPFGADIPGESARLRALGPVVPVELPGGIPAWAPTGYDTLRELILDPRVSKDPRLHWRLWPEIGEHPAWSWILGWVGVVNMLSTYGPDHTRLRRLVAPSFTHRRTEAMRPRVEAITAELLDALDASGDHVAELREAFAHPLPMRMICELFGVPEELWQDTGRLVAALMDTSDPSPEHAASVQRRIGTVLPALIAHKSEHPGDDLTTELIRVRDEGGDRLTDEELLYTLLLVIGAGFETTVNLIGNAVVALLTHPGQLAAVRSGRIGWDAVVDETLRVHPSIASLPLRYAVTDITIGGVTVPRTTDRTRTPSTRRAVPTTIWRSASECTGASVLRSPARRP